MTKNKLEKLISGSMANWREKGWFVMKLHNNPLAHQTTPADYLLTVPQDNFSIKVVLLEAKQVTCDADGSGRFAFKRLKQKEDLSQFQNMNSFHSSYVALAFYDGRWANSELYIIPINDLKTFIESESWAKESINRNEAKTWFGAYKIEVLQGGVISWTP